MQNPTQGLAALALALLLSSCQAANKPILVAPPTGMEAAPAANAPAATTPGTPGAAAAPGSAAAPGTAAAPGAPAAPGAAPVNHLPPSNVITPTSAGSSSGGNGSGPGGGSGGSGGGFSVVACPAQTFVQVERLGRPAINEGLVRGNANLNAFNSIGPSFDLMNTNTAVAAVLSDADTTLLALGNGAMGTTTSHNTLVNPTMPNVVTTAALEGAVLPDVMRIDMSVPSTYAQLSATKRIPFGGRRITDDVIDITLALIVPDETNAAYNGMGLKIRTDSVGYTDKYRNTTTRIHSPVLATFPFAPAPN